MKRKDLIGYDYTGAQPFTTTVNVKAVDDCNGFVVVNTGTTIATVNGHILYPGTPGTVNGDAYVWGGHFGEVYRGYIKVSFSAAVGSEVTIDQKFYTNLD